MAGIGITLKELFQKDTYIGRVQAYVYSSAIAAGPWISAVLVVNIMLIISAYLIVLPIERFLFMGTIVYSFVFSQIITAPWQFLIARYLADKLFQNEFDYIRPAFIGLTKIIFTFALVAAIVFYYNKPLPGYYTYMAGTLFIILSLIWIIMVFLSAAKNYKAIAKAFIFGGLISIFLTYIFLMYPIPFMEHTSAANILLAYLIGVLTTYIILIYSFFDTFSFGNYLEYDFLRYFNKVGILFSIGLFYTLGIWIDNLLMWYSEHGAIIMETFRYAPLYDHAKFLALLTIIPTTVLFMVQVETEFYDKYKRYYQTVRGESTFADITEARSKMVGLLYRHLVYLLERQILITFTIIVLSGYIFVYLGYSVLLQDMFRICALGALSNAIMLAVLLILLYFEARKEALLVSITFFIANLTLTWYLMPLGSDYFGFGFFLSALIALAVSIVCLILCLKSLNYRTFSKQPYILIPDSGLFVKIADKLNVLSLYLSDKNFVFPKNNTLYSQDQETRAGK
ncbi:MAG: exopolysaccharide Pel transporter PelG [Dethiobacter sp.]|jgi:uncharacterized membrane protein|nr:exopolysaccharide Pel transporter PelG [Dethiobacter sp.]